MSDARKETRTVTLERRLSHPVEKVWRALTQPHLVREWLLDGDFLPEVGHKFAFRQPWGEIDCRITEVEVGRCISYTWDALNVQSVVTWTLTPDGEGTLLTMQQCGFRADQKRAYGGAKVGWSRFLDNFEDLLIRRHV